MAKKSTKKESVSRGSVVAQVVDSLREGMGFLVEGEYAAAIALAVALNDGRRDLESVSKTLNRIGFELSAADIERTVARLPLEAAPEMERALRQSGWGAYLRRGRNVLAEGGVE